MVSIRDAEGAKKSLKFTRAAKEDEESPLKVEEKADEAGNPVGQSEVVNQPKVVAGNKDRLPWVVPFAIASLLAVLLGLAVCWCYKDEAKNGNDQEQEV